MAILYRNGDWVIADQNIPGDNCLGNLTPNPVSCPNKEKEMYCKSNSATAVIQAQDDTELQQKKHFLARIDEIFAEHKAVLREKFHMNGPKFPETLGELREFLARGDIVVDDRGYLDNKSIGEMYSWLTVKGPKKDTEGYKAAKARLLKAAKETEDSVWALYPAEYLKAVQKFENWK